MTVPHWVSSSFSVCFLSSVILFTASTACAQSASSQDELGAARDSSSQAGMSSYAKLAVPEAPAPGASAAAGQYGGGGRYGKARRSMWENVAVEFGGGFNAPHPDSTPYITWGGQFDAGVGYHIGQVLTLFAKYQFIDDKLPGNLIAETGADGGNAHIWSLTLEPVVSLFPKSTNDIYLVGGGGFYRKVTNFTDPVLTEYCDYYYCSIGTTNQVVGHFSSNQGGWNIGAGYQHRLGGKFSESRMKIYMEARYLKVLTPAVTTEPNGLGTTTVGADTILIPATFGVRW
jgi:hypothetical protein